MKTTKNKQTTKTAKKIINTTKKNAHENQQTKKKT